MSPPADPVTALGERILAELGDPRTNNTLTRWLAHHTARLIDAADQAATRHDTDADDLATRARTAILELWEHRSAWPHGWPPGGAATLVRLLDDLPEVDDSGWRSHTALGRLQLLHHHLLAALTDRAVADGDTVAEGWLRTFGHRLAQDEVALLTRAASAPRRLATLFSEDLRTVQRRPHNAENCGATSAFPEVDNATAEESECDDEIAPDNTVDVMSNPIMEIAEKYRDVVAELFRGSEADNA